MPPYIIAEAGANANSNLNIAFELVDKAAEAGADAIKFQHYKAENLVTKTAPKYYVDTMEQWESSAEPSGYQYEEFSQLDGLTFENWQKVKERCDRKKITFLSTPFDVEQLEILEKLKVPAYKIASADINYHSFIKAVAEKNKPVLLSTGASTMSEIREAVSVIESTGNKQIIILQCTLHYPCHYDEVNINVITTLKKEFPDYCIGLSDHSLGILVPIVSASLGASVIEKHYTVDKSLSTSTDHFMSVDPDELKSLVEQTKIIPDILGSTKKELLECEDDAVLYARRSLIASRKILAGELITNDNTIIKRPGTGITPNNAESLLKNKVRAKSFISAETIIQNDMLIQELI